MRTNLYLKAALFGSVIPVLITTAVFTLVFFTAQGWTPLIVLVVGLYALPISLVVSMLIALWKLRACKTWVQTLLGLLICGVCVIVTAKVMEYFN